MLEGYMWRHTLIFFPLPIKRFQAALAQHMTAEVCVVLPKFKLSLVQVKPLLVSEHIQGTEQTSADLCAPAAVLRDAGQGDLAYVLHTSGTTGLPKIVRVPHKCILPNIHHLRSVLYLFVTIALLRIV